MCAAPASAASQSLDYHAPLINGVAVTSGAPFGDDTVVVERLDNPRDARGGGHVTLYNRRGVVRLGWGPSTTPRSCSPVGPVCTDTASGAVTGITGAYAHAAGPFTLQRTDERPLGGDTILDQFNGSIDLGSPGPITSAGPLAAGRHVVAATLTATSSGPRDWREYAGTPAGRPFRPGDAALVEIPNDGRFRRGTLVVFGTDGSRLEATVSGHQTPGSDISGAAVTATATVTGGVGRFSGATGRLTLRGKPGIDGSTKYRITGALTVPRQLKMHFRAGVDENVASDRGAEIRIGQGERGASQGVLRFTLHRGGRWSLVDYLPRGNVFASGTDRVVATASVGAVTIETHAARGRISGGTGRYRGARGAFDFVYENTNAPDSEHETLTYDIDANVLLGRAVRVRPPARARSQRLGIRAVVQGVFGSPHPRGQWLYGVPHGAPLDGDAVLLSRTTGTGHHAATIVLIYDRTGMLEAHVGGFGLGTFTRGTGRYRGARGTAIYGVGPFLPDVPQHDATLNGKLRF